jgi:two-component system nitrate/nitrite response regulator NarL
MRGWQGEVNMATSTFYDSLPPRVRVLVADDHEVMRLGIRNLLELHPGWSVCAEANNGQEAVEKTLQFHPDVIIMDISMPVMNGLEAASHITKKEPTIPVILFSLHLSDDLSRHFDTGGIRGAVAKGNAARDLVLAIETVLAGGTFFPGQKSGSN